MLALQVSDQAETLRLRPQVGKTFIKGAILIAAFSVFLNINASTILNYFIFLALAMCVLSSVAWAKRASVFELAEEGVVVRRFPFKQKSIPYPDIVDLSISQGVLAKRFRCGSVFLVLKSGRGNTRIMGGGTAEKLEDVRDPDAVRKFVADRISFFAAPTD